MSILKLQVIKHELDLDMGLDAGSHNGRADGFMNEIRSANRKSPLFVFDISF